MLYEPRHYVCHFATRFIFEFVSADGNVHIFDGRMREECMIFSCKSFDSVSNFSSLGSKRSTASSSIDCNQISYQLRVCQLDASSDNVLFTCLTSCGCTFGFDLRYSKTCLSFFPSPNECHSTTVRSSSQFPWTSPVAVHWSRSRFVCRGLIVQKFNDRSPFLFFFSLLCCLFVCLMFFLSLLCLL